jgi:hypothetical protein
MSAEGSVESGAAEGRSPALERLFLSARHGVHTAANAAGRSASTAFNSAKESLESIRDSTHKTAGSLDKWAAAGVVSAIAAASAACARHTAYMRCHYSAAFLRGPFLRLCACWWRCPAGGAHLPFQGAVGQVHNRAASGADHLPHGEGGLQHTHGSALYNQMTGSASRLRCVCGPMGAGQLAHRPVPASCHQPAPGAPL